MNVLRSLKHRPFALLWTGQTTSRLGDNLYRIALAWWMLEETGSAIGRVCSAVFGLIWTHTLQEMVPGDLLRRVSSMDVLGSFVLLPIGFGLAGWATELVGAPMVFLVGGFGTILLAILPLLHPAIRNLD
jgi:hypothetical protein